LDILNSISESMARSLSLASEQIIFVSEKMMERSTSRSLCPMIWQMGNHKLNSETKRILFLFFASRPWMQITVVETRLFYPSKMPPWDAKTRTGICVKERKVHFEFQATFIQALGRVGLLWEWVPVDGQRSEDGSFENV
jgi:hypothetical protein